MPLPQLLEVAVSGGSWCKVTLPLNCPTTLIQYIFLDDLSLLIVLDLYISP